MIGGIFGDIVGSVHERSPWQSTDFELFHAQARFTDDTVLALAVADALLSDGDYARALHRWGNAYPHAGYGASFRGWLRSEDRQPYGSWGNGSAMRVAPVAWAFDDEHQVLAEAARSAAVTHDHPEGIRGASAVALAVFLARTGTSAAALSEEIEGRFGYDVSTPVSEIRPHYSFDLSCLGSVPQALRCAIEARSSEDAVRLAVSLGGDADTQACIAGAVAEARFGPLPGEIESVVRSYLDARQLDTLDRFRQAHVRPREARMKGPQQGLPIL